MEARDDINRLIDQFNEGTLSTSELKKLEELIANGVVNIDQFKELQGLYDQVELSHPEPSSHLNGRFYAMLAAQKRRPSWFEGFDQLWATKPVVRWAYSLTLVVIGVLGGFWLRTGQSSDVIEINQLSAEVKEMKEMMMLNLLEKESISDRLKAVNLTKELPDASSRITSALLQTLNNDENVNVRLGALEALLPYADDSKVRMGLIESIAKQESPLVQVGLAEMMLALQERRSVKAFQDLLDKEETPDEVKQRINETIEILI